MSGFSYTAINAEGFELKGEIDAASEDAAREQLRAKGLLPITLVGHAAGTGKAAKARFQRVKPKSLQIFSRQFATMIEAGLSIVAALAILEEQTSDKYLQDVIREIRLDVEGGLLLSQAMARHPKVFSSLYVSMVEAGESAGILDTVLDRVAIQIEKETKLRRRVKGAMMYPTVVLSFATLVLIGMLMFLVPVFVGVFEDLGGDLPTPTKLVVGASNLLKGYWYIIFPLAIAAFFGLRHYKKTERGRQQWDRLKLRVPMGIGEIVLKVAVARFSRTLSSLVAAGVDIIKALEITGQTAGNWVLEQALANVRAKVHEGVPIAQPLVESPVFPAMVSEMVRIGEETGELEKMLGKVADFYEDEVDNSVATLTSVIEPIMMMGVGVMVGIIVISMYLPMFKMLTLIK